MPDRGDSGTSRHPMNTNIHIFVGIFVGYALLRHVDFSGDVNTASARSKRTSS